MHQKILGVTVLLFLTNLSLGMESTDPYVQLIINTMRHCYADMGKTDVSLAKCMAKELNTKDNPRSFRVKLYNSDFSEDKRSKIHLLIYNKNGFIVSCKGTAKDTITLDHCKKYQGKTLTSEELMSI